MGSDSNFDPTENPPLLLSLEEPMADQFLMRRQAMTARTCLFKRDESGFQAAFASFIANFPDQIQKGKTEFLYQAIFISAMALVDQNFESELSVGGGRLDLHLQGPHGDDYVIEIKCREANDNLEKKTREAFDQIEDRKYCLKFQGAGNRI
jgi:hypothetical protein